jgi:hypothetical protein
MKFLFINTYYPQFLKSFYKEQLIGVQEKSYQNHQQILLDELFGDADFYSTGIRVHGHEAQDVIVNDELLQKKWAAEHGVACKSSKINNHLSRLKYFKIFFKPDWVYQVLEAQINEYDPDVLYFQSIEYFSPLFLKKIKKNKKRIVVAQKASPVSKLWCFKQADLVFTSFPHFVERFRKQGIPSEYLKLAFGEKVLKVIPPQQKKFNCTFIGGLSKHHTKGLELLSLIAEKTEVDFFGYGKDILDPSSKIFQKHHGEVWGKDMYRTMMQSTMTINRHIDVAEEYANNMRLYEATGSGALLLTDMKKNLNELFKVGEEVIAYEGVDDLVDKIKYFAEHEQEASKIAAAGQARTLKDHTFTVRMKEVIEKITALC